MMGKVLVRKASADATNLVSSFLGEGPKSNLGAALGGGLGGLSFLTRLATAGEQQQDAISGLGSAGLAAYGGYKGGASLGDGVMDVGTRMDHKIRGTPDQREAAAAQEAWNQQAHPSKPISARPEVHEGAHAAEAAQEAWNQQAHPSKPISARPEVHEGAHAAEAAQDQWNKDQQAAQEAGLRAVDATRQARRDHATDPSSLAFDPDFGLHEVGRLGTRDPANPLTGRFRLPEGGFAPNMFSPSYSQTAHHRNLMQPGGLITPLTPPPPPVTDTPDYDMQNSTDHSMADVDGGPSTAVTEFDPNAATKLVNDKTKHEELIGEFDDAIANGEPMDIAFLILKAVMK